MRKTLMILVVAATISGLAACSSSGSDDSSATSTTAPKETTTTEAPVPVAAWAKTLCTSFDAWLSTIQEASDSVGDGVKAGDVASGRTAVADLYGTMSTATQTLIEAIQADGAPAIDDGDRFQAELIEKFQAVDQSAQDTKEQVEALTTTDADEFKQQVDELGNDFQSEVEKVSSSLDELGKKYPSTELSKQLESACQF